MKNIADWINGKQNDIFRQIVLSSAAGSDGRERLRLERRFAGSGFGRSHVFECQFV